MPSVNWYVPRADEFGFCAVLESSYPPLSAPLTKRLYSSKSNTSSVSVTAGGPSLRVSMPCMYCSCIATRGSIPKAFLALSTVLAVSIFLLEVSLAKANRALAIVSSVGGGVVTAVSDCPIKS